MEDVKGHDKERNKRNGSFGGVEGYGKGFRMVKKYRGGFTVEKHISEETMWFHLRI